MDDVNCNKNWRRGYWRVLVVSGSMFPFFHFLFVKYIVVVDLGGRIKIMADIQMVCFWSSESKRDIMLKNYSKRLPSMCLRKDQISFWEKKSYLLPSLKKNDNHCGWGQILKHSFRMLVWINLFFKILADVTWRSASV